MRQILTISLLFSTIRLATPLVWAALGGLYSERSGVINIALEGLMLAGAFTAASVTYYAHNPWVGLGAAMLAGDPGGLHHCARLHSLQSRSGGDRHRNQHLVHWPAGRTQWSAVSLLRLDAANSEREFAADARSFITFHAAWRILTEVSVISLLALVIVLVTRYIFYRTPFGLRLRAVGENPEAADAAGVGVNRIRYVGVILSGALAGVGGAYLSIGQSSLFTRNMAAGRGFIALAALIFGKWRPVQTLLACLLFGFAEAFTIQMQGVPVS